MGLQSLSLSFRENKIPLPIEDTQAFIAGSDDMIIVAFRGTEPIKIADWLTDANTPAYPGPARKGLVHLGFHLALAVVTADLLAPGTDGIRDHSLVNYLANIEKNLDDSR